MFELNGDDVIYEAGVLVCCIKQGRIKTGNVRINVTLWRIRLPLLQWENNKYCML
jgi:hypothetical protein